MTARRHAIDEEADEAARSVNSELTLGPRWLYPAKAALTKTRSLIWLTRRRGRNQTNGLRILFYHRIAADRDELAVRPDEFERQMDVLARSGLRVVDVAEAVRLLHVGCDDFVSLSFDDGYHDVLENALPILRKHGFRASVFIPTGVVDGVASFTWYSRQPAMLSWEEIVELDREGTLRFEAHSVTHVDLRAIGNKQARWEIAESKRALEQHLGHPVDIFCYPGGLFGPRERAYAQEVGFSAAVTCEPGLNMSEGDRYALRRIQIDRRDRLFDFRAKLGGAHDRPLPLRSMYRRIRYRL